jgi:4-oxalmesaconate hydratase
MTMIIDCHGHYTVLPKAHDAWREQQKAAFKAGGRAALSRDQRRRDPRDDRGQPASPDQGTRRGHDDLFAPRQRHGPACGRPERGRAWAQACNNLIARVVALYPETFAGVCMLPQSPEADMTSSIAELERCVTELGFIGCNLNPDPGGGHFSIRR